MAIRVTVLKDLENRLRNWHNGMSKEEPEALIGALVNLLDDELRKREMGSEKTGDKHLGFKELVSLFRFHLGADLVLPPKPSSEWVIRHVILAKNMGVNKDNVEQIVRGLRRGYPRGPYQFGFILGRADVHYAAGEVRGSGEQFEEAAQVFTGRPGDAED